MPGAEVRDFFLLIRLARGQRKIETMMKKPQKLETEINCEAWNIYRIPLLTKILNTQYSRCLPEIHQSPSFNLRRARLDLPLWQIYRYPDVRYIHYSSQARAPSSPPFYHNSFQRIAITEKVLKKKMINAQLLTRLKHECSCYNNCPQDPGRFGVDSAKVANCNAADTLRTTTPVSTLKPTATKNTGAASQTSGESTATGTGARSSASATGNAAAGMVVVGGEMGMGGLVWMLLAGIGYLMWKSCVWGGGVW